MTVENKEFYKKQLQNMWLYALLAFFIGTVMVSAAMEIVEKPWYHALGFGLLCSGIPCGWSITGKVFGGSWVVIGIFGIILAVVRLMLSLVIGLLALPIQTLNYLSLIHSAPD